MFTELQEFNYFKGKKQDAAVQFSISKQRKTLISKTT